MTEAQVACLTDKEAAVADPAEYGTSSRASADKQAEFTVGERAAIAMGEEMTRMARVSEPTFAELRKHWNERQVVELVAVAGLFNYFNRFNNALEVELTVYPKPL